MRFSYNLDLLVSISAIHKEELLGCVACCLLQIENITNYQALQLPFIYGKA